jgi:hypothetical protein
MAKEFNIGKTTVNISVSWIKSIRMGFIWLTLTRGDKTSSYSISTTGRTFSGFYLLPTIHIHCHKAAYPGRKDVTAKLVWLVWEMDLLRKTVQYKESDSADMELYVSL